MRTSIHPDQALKLVTDAGKAVSVGIGTDSVSIQEGLGRGLARPVFSGIDHPPFAKSAMDGFAVSCRSENDVYRVIEAVSAGKTSVRSPGPGEAIRIMTGAPVPPGTSFVQRVEWTAEAGSDATGLPLVRFTKPEGVSNVIARGENLAAGAELLGPRILQPQDIGILASAGIAEVEVSRRLKVAVVSTGDELAAPGSPLEAASIYDSNGPQLRAQCKAFGASADYLGIVPDRGDALRAVLGQALRDFDLVLVSGGVSLGDFDLVPATLEALGVRTVFHGLSMRPGKPTYFGTLGSKAVFGLPGNPVSTFVNFEVLVKPYLASCAGLGYVPDCCKARLGAGLVRKGTDRVEFLPAVLRADSGGMVADPLRYHGSSMVTILALANCLLRMELGVEAIAEGEIVDARRIRA
jgi:molybdopterin molybdotransferase